MPQYEIGPHVPHNVPDSQMLQRWYVKKVEYDADGHSQLHAVDFQIGERKILNYPKHPWIV